ncbi:hypothetical protein [Robiginitalea marina]|uniref:Uncharacterized protein n=1 Tax=Robiginitalea marina TaxID=2954105 RepID=A0ABT1AYL9_9FLAO|nr:hypothetical protein [Robiginitalea marina]MCO5725134.1 hypothetical protein [Robiginitalea marina]
MEFPIKPGSGGIAALIPMVFPITRWQNKNSYQAFYETANTYLVIAGVGLFIYKLYGYLSGH